jgi:hypothetical protein
LDVVGAPRWKGTTDEEVADPIPVGCTMTCVAVIVVPSTVPSTRTGSPVATALADVEVVPFSYAVELTSPTVTFCPADVDMVKLDAATLPTVPEAPPAAGPDRALEPAAAGPSATPLPDTTCAVVAECDVVSPTAAPTAEHVSTAAAIQ